MHVVYQKMTTDSYPVMIAVFLMKSDAEGFINNNYLGTASYAVELVEETWGYWNKIREKLNEQVYRPEEEEEEE